MRSDNLLQGPESSQSPFKAISSDLNRHYIRFIDDRSRASNETLINDHKQTQSIAMNQTGRAEIQFSLSAHFSPY